MRPAKTKPGRVIGSYTAVAPTRKRYGAAIVWQWRCECGRTATYVPAMLAALARRPQGVKCNHPPAPSLGRPSLDLSGQKFGKLTAIDIARRTRRGDCVWRCECECGATSTVRATRLQSHTTLMCAECAAERRASPDGYRVQNARFAAGLTLRQAAKILGISTQKMGAIENQISVPDVDGVIDSILTAPKGDQK